MTIDQLVSVVTQAGVPGVLILWLYFTIRERNNEREERRRLQRVLEGYLPVLRNTQQAMRNVSRIIGGDEDAEEADGR